LNFLFRKVDGILSPLMARLLGHSIPGLGLLATLLLIFLIGILAQTRKKEQTVRMTGLSAHFQKIFAMVGLTKYAQIHPSEDAALAGF